MKLLYLIASILFSSQLLASEDEPIWKFTSSSQIISNQKILEFWTTNNSNDNGLYSHEFKVRYYNPLELDNWRGTLRLDASVISTSPHAFIANNTGQYSAGNTMITIWGQNDGFLKTLNATIGGRVILPFGNNGQWAVGPQLGWAFKPSTGTKTAISDISPVVRYMYGFDTKNNSLAVNPNQPSLERNLQLFPTIGFEIARYTQLRFWDENGMTFNTAGGSWFIPIDAMVTHRVNKYFLFAVGASKKIVDTYQQYDWSLYGKVSFNF